MPTTLKFSVLLLIVFHVVSCCCLSINDEGWSSGKEDAHWGGGTASSSGSYALVKKEDRKSVVKTEYGEISTVDVDDGAWGLYHVEFITLEPNAIFLPVLLHAEMVLYVHTGCGRLIWIDEKDIKKVDLRRGDIFRLPPGVVFHVQSGLEPERKKLRINAIFANTEHKYYEPSIGAYSSLAHLLRGFDKRVLQEAFQAPVEVIEELTSASPPPPIVHAFTDRVKLWEWETRFLKTYLRGSANVLASISNKKSKTFNLYKADKDVENCNGWSVSVTRKDTHSLKHSGFSVFMVNLTKGSMMGPHWNPEATEIAVVLEGEGMARVVCASTAKETECNNTRFMIEEGDVFVVPRFHPMAQMAFNNGSLVFVGFTTSKSRNYPQFLVGKWSIFRAIDRKVLAASFNVSNTTVDRILTPQKESVILECTSCAEEEQHLMEEEIERKREEEEERRRREEEEEARKREEEEARRREEEEAKRREEEEARRREEEEAQRREEEEEAARKREEEEARRREEEAKRREEEEEEKEAKRREEEEARRREEEEAQRREEEEEAARKREEEEARRREEEEAKRREEEEAQRREKEAMRRQEEEEARRQEEEDARRQRQEEEEAQRRQEEEAKQEEEEEERRQEEKWRRRQEEEEARARRQEEEAQRRQEEEARREEEEEARREEEEAAKRQEEAMRRQQEEEEARMREEEERRREESAQREQEEARRQEEEMEWRQRSGRTQSSGRRRDRNTNTYHKSII